MGGKLGKALRESGFETMGDLQGLDAEDDLAPIIGHENAIWVKGLSLGICDEMVSEKKIPKSAGAIKTFNAITSFEKIQKHIQLVSLDIIMKIKENLKEYNIFPQSVQAYQKNRQIWIHDHENGQTFKKTLKMVSYEDFMENTGSFTALLVQVFKEAFEAGQLPFPARMLGATVSNFKPVYQIKLPSRKIDHIFGKPKDVAALEQLRI